MRLYCARQVSDSVWIDFPKWEKCKMFLKDERVWRGNRCTGNGVPQLIFPVWEYFHLIINFILNLSNSHTDLCELWTVVSEFVLQNLRFCGIDSLVWSLSQAIEKSCRVSGGFSGVKDVYSSTPTHDDVQQSFFLAETLKWVDAFTNVLL